MAIERKIRIFSKSDTVRFTQLGRVCFLLQDFDQFFRKTNLDKVTTHASLLHPGVDKSPAEISMEVLVTKNTVYGMYLIRKALVNHFDKKGLGDVAREVVEKYPLVGES